MSASLRRFAVVPLALFWLGGGSLPAAQDPPAAGKVEVGVLPKGANGKALNLDFETGTLQDWTVEGAAFEGQPVKGDVVFARRKDMKSEHTGTFWVGSFENNAGDGPTGTLTSVPFEVTHPWAVFLIAGGSTDESCVEIVRADTREVIHRAVGTQTENLRRAVVDLQKHQGKQIFIRLVDRGTGPWGHLNFDDFRFFQDKPWVPPQRPADLLEFAGLSPEDAARAMTVPQGFKVTAFAGEPDVQQPIAMTIDPRGRLWVAEAYAYPVRVKPEEARDRILIFEDVDGDGKFDKRTVFADKLNLVSGIEVGFGGVWVGAAPEFLFIPDRDGNDVPDGPPEVLLDGWGYQDTHETLNSFIWGPDGWLYGCHGVFTHSNVGKPGAGNDQRTRLNAGIWRYHPTRHQFEVFAYGTSNPWGVDFNDQGQCFLTCCVIPHLFHMVQGARYLRQGGEHFQKQTYADIGTIANHRHWVGSQWNEADRARSDTNGGGHAHAGAMIYLGGTWPAEYRNQLFMNNIHGARLNLDKLTPRGSGYEGDGLPDFCRTNDLWSQILYLRYGPDGQVYMIDWYDRNQCHHGNVPGHDRSNGRIFKISYGTSRAEPVDLNKATDDQLVQYQLHENDWYVRTARRLLQERAAAGRLSASAREGLRQIATTHAEPTRRLRGQWALHVTGGIPANVAEQLLADADPYVRGWMVQLLCELAPGADVPGRLAQLAAHDASPVVRLYVASALQRLPLDQRWDAVQGLLSQSADVDDHNLPLMNWYAAEPLAEVDASRALALTAQGKFPLVHEFMIRRIGSLGTPESLDQLVAALGKATDNETRRRYLSGLQAALKGRRRVEMPAGWGEVRAGLEASPAAELRNLAFGLSAKFGDPAVFGKMRGAVADRQVPLAERQSYLDSLLGAKDPQLAPVLRQLLDDDALRSAAIRGLAGYDDGPAPALLIERYAQLPPQEKRDVLSTLTARPGYAVALLDAIGDKRLPATDLTADFVRQLRNLKNDPLNAKIEQHWGVVRDTPEEKAKLISHYKELISAEPAKEEDLPRGRAVFAKVCQQCHTLFGSGGKVGPELTGSNRANLDYLLSNVVDPSAVLAREYTPRIIATQGGRVITGLVKEETPQAVTVLTANETIVLPKDEIEEMKPSDKSMMPDDLLKPLSEDDVRALAGYLASPRQVALLATPDTVASFFNGKTLDGWLGNPQLWSVENGEIVGRSPGLKRNEFLISQMQVGDFSLAFEVKLTPNSENSGVQFRSQPLAEGEVKGYQADIGAGWWGKLYEEHGRALLWDKPGDAHVRPGDWNRYRIEARDSRIRTFINDQPCVDLDDPEGARRGLIALQLHSGGQLEVRFRALELKLE
jgi:putative membrane-bound dehydrogenase-like protein